LGQKFCELCIQLLDLRQFLQPGFVKGSFRRLVQGDCLPVSFQKGLAVISLREPQRKDPYKIQKRFLYFSCTVFPYSVLIHLIKGSKGQCSGLFFGRLLHGSVITAEMPDVMCSLETFVTDKVLWQESLFSCHRTGAQ